MNIKKRRKLMEEEKKIEEQTLSISEEQAEHTVQTEFSAQDKSSEQVEKLIRHHIYTSMAVGLIPIPFVDFLGVTGVQINLIRKLAFMFDVPFSKERTKNIIAALIGGTIPAASSFTVASTLKGIPIIGLSLGAVSMPVISGASTYAIGKVFYRHFASGGTFLTLDSDKAKQYYEEMFQKGKNVSKAMQPKPA
jgi:uncharacterized protein (DUF697 family)